MSDIFDYGVENAFRPFTLGKLGAGRTVVGLGPLLLAAAALAGTPMPSAKSSGSIPWLEIGAKAGADYKGDGLAISATAFGARLRCVFQRLEGEATHEGLWLTSTVSKAVIDRFRVTATEVGRVTPCAPGHRAEPSTLNPQLSTLPRTGTVSAEGQTVRFNRPGLTEEYSVGMDGVRQDFVIEQRPQGAGELAVWLAVNGAKIEPAAGGAQLVLDNSGRRIAYNRLRVTDAAGKELAACIEVPSLGDEVSVFKSHGDKDAFHRVPIVSGGDQGRDWTAPSLVVLVEDSDAVYPIRIDPTFSDANWMSMGGGITAGVNGTVGAAAVDASGNLYVSGGTVAGNVLANGIAKWDGANWSALGSGIDGASALAVSGNDLYAAGYFTTAGGMEATNIAKWDGSRWSALGSGIGGNGNPFVNALAVSGSNVYAAGFFFEAGGVPANHIAKWNGTNWSALGSGLNAEVYALAVSGSDLYAAGSFTTAGDSAATHIAKWDGTSWSALGSGLGNDSWGVSVRALAVSGANVYAGGQFTTAGGLAATNIAKWDGANWSALGWGLGGPYETVSALVVSGSNVYAGGVFMSAGGLATTNIAKWDGANWSPLGSGVNSVVFVLAVSGSNLYAGGGFTKAGGLEASGIARWDGGTWLALGTSGHGVNSAVQALAASGRDLFVGGSFTATDGISVDHIAKWDGTNLSALGSGIVGANEWVSALAVSGSDLYAGGGFSTAGGVTANCIAKWNGTNWSAMGSGMGGDPDVTVYLYVLALAVSGSDVYAGGDFTTAGGLAATNIAKWDGSAWSPLGSGMDGMVYALAASGSNLYAGGNFTAASGLAARGVAKWDGSTWSALGSGMNNSVLALAVLGSDIYAGGYFTTAGGVLASNIAKWNGTSWSALGSGIGGGVNALAVSGSDLYAGGVFTMAGGIPANCIAKWNGTNWSALGSGIGGPVNNPTVWDLAVSDSDLYSGGDFITAGGKVSAYLARAYLPELPTLSVRRSGANVRVFWRSADTAGFAMEQASTLAAPANWVTNSASVTDDGTNRSVTLPTTNRAQFFRLRRP